MKRWRPSGRRWVGRRIPRDHGLTSRSKLFAKAGAVLLLLSVPMKFLKESLLGFDIGGRCNHIGLSVAADQAWKLHELRPIGWTIRGGKLPVSLPHRGHGLGPAAMSLPLP